MVRCAIFGCKSDPESKNFRNEKVMFFRFPKDKGLNKVWKNKCCRADDFSTVNARICSKHFDLNKDFVRNLKYELLGAPPPKTCRKLKPDAVPTLHLPVRSLAVSSVSYHKAANARAQRNEKRHQAKVVQDILASRLTESRYVLS